MLAQATPLHGKRKLLGLDPLNLGSQLPAHARHRGGLPVAYISRPKPPRLPLMDGAQRLKQRIVGEPPPGSCQKLLVVGSMGVRKLLRVDERVLAGKVGAYPVR